MKRMMFLLYRKIVKKDKVFTKVKLTKIIMYGIMIY